jgi:hypothetical protein
MVLQPRVVNHSTSGVSGVALCAYVDDKEVARTTVAIGPGQTVTQALVYVPTEPGEHRGRFEVLPSTQDRFPDDDRFCFCLSIAPRSRVLLVTGPNRADGGVDEGYYLRAALTLPAYDQALNIPGDTPAAGKSIDLQELRQADLSALRLEGIDVVVLANCGKITPLQGACLRNFVAGGGGLLIFPGDQVEAANYNEMFSVPGLPGQRLMDIEVRPPEGDPDNAETFERLGRIDFSHPALRVFEPGEAIYWKSPRFYRRFHLDPGVSPTNAWILAHFSDGAPALVESRFREGKVVVAAFPAHARWTNLPLKPEFVPLVLHLIQRIQRPPEATVPTIVPPDAVAHVDASARWTQPAGTVIGPGGASHPLSFSRVAPGYSAAFEQTDERGFYAGEVNGQVAGMAKKTPLLFAVNVDPEESDLTQIGEEALRTLFPGVHFTFVDASSEAQRAYGDLGAERNIWKALIWSLLALIGLEFMLATLGGENATALGRALGSACAWARPRTWTGTDVTLQ